MKKFYLFLVAALALGFYSACDDPDNPLDDPVNNNTNKGDTIKGDTLKPDTLKPDTLKPAPLVLSANSFKLGNDTVKFSVVDTLTIQEGVMRIFGYNGSSLAGNRSPIMHFSVNVTENLLNRDIDLALASFRDTIYDPLSFLLDFMNAGCTDSMFVSLDWDWDPVGNTTYRTFKGAFNADTVQTFIKSGTLRMELDTLKKEFTFNVNAILYDDSAFELNLSVPYKVQYIFNFFTHSHETWDPYTYESLTSFEEFDKAAGPEGFNTFTVEAADTTAQAKFAAFKVAIGRFVTLIGKIDDQKAMEGFYDAKDRFVIKLVTWGFGGHNRVLAYKKWWKNRSVETWIAEDDYVRSTLLYYPGDEDFWEYDDPN